MMGIWLEGGTLTRASNTVDPKSGSQTEIRMYWHLLSPVILRKLILCLEQSIGLINFVELHQHFTDFSDASFAACNKI